MPPCCTPYKGFLLVVCGLFLLYFFSAIVDDKHGDSVYTFNTTRVDKNIEQIHSPLLKSLFSSKRTNKTNKHNSSQEDYRIRNSSVTSLIDTVNVSSSVNTPPPLVPFEVTTAETEKSNSTELPLCPEYPPGLGTSVKVQKSPVPSIPELERNFSWLHPGGHWYPPDCRVLKKVALIVPFRCRAEHLLLFLRHMHPFLKKQQLDYTIFIVEQDGDGAFNRASLMNVGFREALKLDTFDCFIFHDIDLLPEDERNLYTCPEQPRHMSAAIDSFQYRLPYSTIFGGVSAISTEQFELLNGFSNSFWGWGGEDDDMSNRLRYHNLFISRYPISVARYTMLTHKKEKANPNRYETLKLGKQKYDSDGLSNLQYELKQMKRNLLYTWFLVEIGPRS